MVMGFTWLFALVAVGQIESNHWYFGDGAGLNFNLLGSQIAESDTNGKMYTREGCACVSDSLGDLLFYTNGDSVWNRSHVAMAEGFNLGGHTSTTQSSLIVPKPSDANNYYIFSVGESGDSLFYSEVDMSLNGGLGNIVSGNKRTFLKDSMMEKITALPSTNERGFWVLTYAINNNEYLSFEVTATGVNPTPVISSINPAVKKRLGPLGAMKGNFQGTQIASVFYKSDSIILVDFLPATGQVINPVIWDFDTTDISSGSYGVEFSPAGNLLYVTEYARTAGVIQYDLQAGSPAGIASSAINIAPHLTPTTNGALQLGPDGFIYHTVENGVYIHRIESPNERGLACNFVDSVIYLNNRASQLGLPNIVPALIVDPTFNPARKAQFCPGESITLDATTPGGNYLWDNGSTSSQILVNQEGSYTVTVSVGGFAYTDTVWVESSSDVCCYVDLPNVFSPNFDGQNDFFEPLNGCNLTQFRLLIYNRWGRLVFESKAEGFRWDGYITGQQAPAGVYFWILEYENESAFNENLQKNNGSFTLLR